MKKNYLHAHLLNSITKNSIHKFLSRNGLMYNSQFSILNFHSNWLCYYSADYTGVPFVNKKLHFPKKYFCAISNNYVQLF